MEQNASKESVKQEEGECLPIKQEFEENASRESNRKMDRLPIKQELEEDASYVVVEQEMECVPT